MDVFLNTREMQGLKTLLFVYLLVVKAAAVCPKPEGEGNLVLTTEALLMNDFPEETQVTLECGNGFQTDTGSGVITCIDGKWTKPDLTCKKTDCGPPRPEPNMSFDLTAGTLFGAIIKAVCDKGYRLSGSSFKQCYAPGWSGKAKCNIVTCMIPNEVINGRHLWDSQDKPKYGDPVHYVCDAGFSLIGKVSITCTETGQYDSDPPECQGVAAEETITTKMVTPSPATPAQGGGNIVTTVAPPKVTVHRETTVTSATGTVPPRLQGDRGIMTAEETVAPSTVTPTTSLQDQQDDTLNNNVIGYVIAGVGAILLVGSVILLHKCLMKKKGSYDTREDLKPELLQFQNL
ncbi:complement decay-accelerating factor isoform X2 [Notolabrus celidotus]|uniref:complement decay-accelerating factor isoform X2 n=1 Tax=Notolabrus celidotus TaxID=1203425 RepID=UPI00148FA39C|nr:complement decay-accelerating factor isoform X2 [Notolabrus celidotus]